MVATVLRVQRYGTVWVQPQSGRTKPGILARDTVRQHADLLPGKTS